MTASVSLSPDRYLLARVGDGGVLIDLESGNYFRLNRSAAVICEILLQEQGTEAAAVAQIQQALHLGDDDASRAIRDIVTTTSGPSLRGIVQGSYHFHPTGDGDYRLWHGQRCVLAYAPGHGVWLPSEEAAQVDTGSLELYVRSVAPKLIFQAQGTVFHASACKVDDTLIAFMGVSGAGKTTTAQSFGTAGARLISEDLLVTDIANGEARIVVTGEATIREWARHTALQLASVGVGKHVRVDAIVEALAGPTERLDQVLFLDASRRSGTDFAVRPLPAADTVITLMTHAFLGATEPASWRRFFHEALALSSSVDAKEATAPRGLDGLVPAAKRYISTVAS